MQKYLYLVKSSGGRMLHTWAATSNQAKRAFCREYGIRPSDSWCGLSNLTARRLTQEEVKAWEANAETTRCTSIFIQGMMEIGAKAYEDMKAGENGGN